MSDFRGLVVSPAMTIRGSTLTMGPSTSALDAQLVRTSILLWDKLEWPISPIINLGGDAETEFLEKVGVLQRTRAAKTYGPIGDGAQGMLLDHINIYRSLNDKQPNQWSMARGKDSISFQDVDVGGFVDNHGLIVKLYDAIPIPDREVPLAKILRFKDKRRSELVALRIHLEDVYQRIANAADKPMAETTEITRLQKAISDHVRVSEESKLKLVKIDLAASFNPSGAALTFWSALQSGIGLGTATMIALAAGMLQVKLGAAIKDKSLAGSPFEYVVASKKEVFKA